MYLEKLEINGFKSFAHKVGLSFKPGITAIVGPNGSGKSNCADAIRWVLGEQSIKLLRGKKSEDVIFSGSDKKARLGMAEVSLYFNNNNDEANLGMSEICITRRLYRDGESEYLINKQKARLLDIQMLLAKAGVAHTSYAIIGQGMIDAFLLASPPDRKEFFEEASGVKPLQIKRAQALSKLAQTEDNLATAQVQLGEIEPRLHSLTRQVKKLEQRAELEKNWRELSEQYYGSLWQEIDQEYQIKHQSLVALSTDEEKAKQAAGNAQIELARLTKDNLNTGEINNLQEEYQKMLDKKMQLHEKITQLRIKEAENTAGQVKKDKDIPARLGLEIDNHLLNLKNNFQQLKQALAKFEPADKILLLISDQEKTLSALQEIIAPFVKKDTTAVKNDSMPAVKLAEYQQALNDLNSQLSACQEKIKDHTAKERQERSQIWDIQQNYQVAQEKWNKIIALVNNERVAIARLETRREDLALEIKQELGEHYLSREGFKKTAFNLMNEAEKMSASQEISRLKHQLDLIGGIDPEVSAEYEATKERHTFLSQQLQDLTSAMTSLEKLILELDTTVKKQFETSFQIIDSEFQKYFRVLFAGGKARLVLVKAPVGESVVDGVDGDNINIEPSLSTAHLETEKIRDRLTADIYTGVEIEATPPGKKLKSINMLSGGERAMTSIALICAIIASNPSPFVVLDEVDAALDEANSLRYADILDQLAHKSQFIVITHNRASMEKASILYGVTMGDDGISALLSLEMAHAEKYTNR